MGKILAVLVAAAVFLRLAFTDIGGWMTIAALIFATLLFVRAGVSRRPTIMAIFSATVAVSAIVYLAWRLSSINLVSWWIAIPLFVAEVFGALHLLGFYYTLWPRKEAALNVQTDASRFPVYIFIPTVNEGPAVLRPTIAGSLAARAKYLERYPNGQVNIVICNDGYVANYPKWQEAEALAEEMGVLCITRRVPGGAKAGNIENARQTLGATGDALIVIFDADQIAAPDFLTKTVPAFGDPEIGWVQTGQYYSNLDNVVANWSNDQQAMFYQMLCPSKSPTNSVIICGTNVVIRAKALDEIDGLPQDSITEDMAASIELHRNWRSIYLPDRLVTGLGPMDLRSYFAQQRRWAIGNLTVGRDNWRALLLPGNNGLTLNQRIQYLLACTHYLCGLRDLIYLLTPIIYLTLSVSAIDYTNISTFVWYAVPFWLMGQVAFWFAVAHKTGLRGVMLNFVSFPVFIESVMTVLRGQRVGFQVTSKRRIKSGMQYVRVHLFFLALCIVGLIIGLSRLHTDPAPILVSLFWIGYQMFYLSSIIWLAVGDTLYERVRGLRSALNGVRRVREQVISSRMLGPAAAATAVAMSAWVFISPLSGAFLPFTNTMHATTEPYIGVSLPYEWMAQDGSPEDAWTPVARIVGRTENALDTFDRAWANQLNQQGALPWITMVFDSQSENSALSDSLLAIANGLHDETLHRWARDIRAYRQPVYLSIFPYVDRSWGSPSLLSEGTQLEDLQRAWSRVQEIFAEENATNIFWVWAPGDPVSEDSVTLSIEDIDAVMLRASDYPDVQWNEIHAAVETLAVRYPNASLFIDLSRMDDVDAWFELLNTAHQNQTLPLSISAFLYDEGVRFGDPR